MGGAGARYGGAGSRSSSHTKRISAFGGQAGVGREGGRGGRKEGGRDTHTHTPPRDQPTLSRQDEEEEDDDDEDGQGHRTKPHFIRSLDDKQGTNVKVEKPPMVIAVPVPCWNRKEKEGGKEGGAEERSAPPPLKRENKTLEEEAAEALAREARGGGKDEDEEEGGKEGGRVIQLQPLAHRRLDVGEDAPMLVRNAVPVPKDITDEKVGLSFLPSLPPSLPPWPMAMITDDG